MPDKNTNTATTSSDPKAWLTQHGINEVECLVPDLNGVAARQDLADSQIPQGAGRPRALSAEQRLPGQHRRPLFRLDRRGFCLFGPGHAHGAGRLDALPGAGCRGGQGLCLCRCLPYGRPAMDGLAAPCLAGRARSLSPARLAGGGGAGARILSHRAQSRSGPAADGAGRRQWSRRGRAASL